MEDQLGNFLSEHIKNLTDDVFDEICTHFSPINVKRNQILSRPGRLMRHLYFINRGCLRTYRLNIHDLEITSDLAFEESFNMLTPEFLKRTTGEYYIQALEKSELLTISLDSFKNLALKYAHFYLGIFYTTYIRRQEVSSKIQEDDAIARYVWFKTTKPEVVARVPDKYIASYLGMSTRTLIRAKETLK